MPVDIEGMVSQINVSALSAAEQAGFKDWLQDRPHLQISIRSALQRGQPVRVSPGRLVAKKPVDYFVHL